MNKGEKVKVYFKMSGRCYRLFNVIQMGKDGVVDLKITDYYNHFVIVSKNSNREKGYLTEDEMATSRFVNKSEMSYHKDGSFLNKILDSSKPEYSNPYGQGERWTATSSIKDFQPILNIAIRRMEIYNKSSLHPILKTKETAYICENDDLFEMKGSYRIILLIRNKKFIYNCYSTQNHYSDIITELNEELDLCIFIQRCQYPDPKPYYSKNFQCTITPYLHNSINFFDKDSTKDIIIDHLQGSIFNSTCHHFLSDLADGKFINLTEDKLLLIDQVDILYNGHKDKMSISRAVFIKQALIFFGENLPEFNKLDQMIKQSILKQWNKEIESK